MTFRDTLRDKVLCIDGAMGTMIQALDLGDEHYGGGPYKMLSDMLVLSVPQAIRDIHIAYFRAGASAVETNTFGASPYRLQEYDFSGLNLSAFEEIPYGIDPRTISIADLSYYLGRRGAELACEARDAYRKAPDYDGRPLWVLGSLGPSNRVVSSTRATLASATFEEIQENFRTQVCGLIDGGADVLLFETQQDILELKAAIFGGKQAMAEKSKPLPIMAQVSVDQYSRMQIFHTDIHAAQVTLDGIGIDAFGINCSIGPDLMLKTVEKLSRTCPLPISVVPNAGLPQSVDGKTVFDFDPARFASILHDFVSEYGVSIVGGCCGTTPDHIRCLADSVRTLAPKTRAWDQGCYVSGPQEAVLLDSSKTLIRFGERLNVRGSNAVREAVENDQGVNHDVLEEVVREQVQDLGCSIIDVCMDSNELDTVETLKAVVRSQTTNFPGAMCLDSFQHDALLEAVKVYPGRPILNSVSMEEVSPGRLKIDAVMEATRAHHPVYVGLCTGPKGPGATVAEKVDLAEQIIERASSAYGVTLDQLFIDVNAFPIGAESEPGANFAMASLEAIRELKTRYPGLKTSIGVGNLTNGLAKKPYMRMVLTSVFLDEARKRGLDAAIVNPNHYLFVENLEPSHYKLALRVILERDMDAYAELEEIAEARRGQVTKKRTNYDDLAVESAVMEKIKDGFKEREEGTFEFQGKTYPYADRIVLQVAQALEKHEPLDFVNQYLMQAMQELGDGFGRGEVSLPHLLKSADVMRQAMGFIEANLRHRSGVDSGEAIQPKGTVVLGTVYQDVHSIGKDLARTLLENYGYRVIDLGAMTPLQLFIDAAKENQACAIGMSALLVQTSNHMITVAKMEEEQGLNIPILIGGAAVSPRHGAYVAMAGRENIEDMRGDVFYCRTAMDGVNVMNQLMGTDDRTALYAENRKSLQERLERAQKRDAKAEALLATLPRRDVRHDHAPYPAEPRFRAKRFEFTLREFAEHIHKKTLYSLNWRYGSTAKRERAGHTLEELDRLYEEWIARADDEGWVRPLGVAGLYPCYAEGDTVVVLSPEDGSEEVCRLDFAPIIGMGDADVVSAAQYFRPKGEGPLDVIGLQIASSGVSILPVLETFRAQRETLSALFLQGLSDRVAEDMAQYMHVHLRQLLGLDVAQGQRWSPGYPGMPNLLLNKVLVDVLGATESIGVTVTEAGEFYPTGTTGAAVSFHPKASYT